jgi:ribosome biogenesis GTPase
MTDAQVRRAIVIAVGRNAAWAVIEGTHDAVLAVLRKNDRRTVLAPGDIVDTVRLDAQRVVIEGVNPRTSALVRRTSAGRTKTMAANIDLIAVVAALADPPPSFALVDQLVAFAVQHDVPAALILTKPDLVPPAAPAEVASIYDPLGVPTLTVAPRGGEGIPALRNFLAGKQALLVGNSGVGKSSIFRVLGGTATVGEVSAAGRGRQTTTSARLFQSAGGFLIDSPGIGEFTLDPVPPAELGWLFVEFREPATHCRFDDCRHLVEPDCAVRTAVADGRIAASRFTSYRQIALAPVAS